MHAHDVIGLLKRDWQIDPIQRLISARECLLIDEGWLYGEFAQSVRVNSNALGLSIYNRESNHCRHIVRRAVSLSVDLHVRGGKHTYASLAVLEFWFFRKGNPEDEHALLLGITHDPVRAIRPLFMEVQAVLRGESGRYETTEPERISCTGLGW
jgi:hypothetical protein